jgi:type IV fimbrial biogenesis protein FimT
MSAGRRFAQTGFSLYDFIITSAVASVLGTGAVSMTDLVKDTRITTNVNQLMAELSLARSEAIKRHTLVTLCTSSDGASCSHDDNWQAGWIMFINDDGDNKVDAGETIIRVQPPLEGNLTLRYGGEKESFSRVTYHPPGYARQNATFTFCDTRGSSKGKAVIINTIGRAYVSTKTWEGNPLKCT